MTAKELSKLLVEKNLKVTPQRIAVLEAIFSLNDHPAAEKIIETIRKSHPNVSTATVYKALDTFVTNGLISRVTTERDIMRYDAFMENHHHLYYSDSDSIEDYRDDELDRLLGEYFSKKRFPGFTIDDIKLQIKGRSTKKKKP